MSDNQTTTPNTEVKPASTTTTFRKGEFNRRSQNSQNSFGNGGDRRNGGNRKPFGQRQDRRPRGEDENEYFSEVIKVRRVTRVSKGGKRMRFSALVVVGDKNGLIGYGLKKGLDFQDAVAKATKKAKENMIKIKRDDAESIAFPLNFKYKSVKIMLKPARSGTGLIAGGFIRPVLSLAGISNIYSKVIGSSNKVTGVQGVLEALKKYV